jgi:hypothetical protein
VKTRKANTQGSLLRRVADSDVYVRHRNIGQLRNGSNSFITHFRISRLAHSPPQLESSCRATTQQSLL